MSYARYLLNGTKVRDLRHREGWKQLGLAVRAGVSLRLVIDVEGEKRPVLFGTAQGIATALNTSVESLTKNTVYRDGPAELPNVEKRYREQLNRARDCDMAGNHDEAIALCKKLLVRIGPSDTQQRAIVVIRLATFL